MNPHLRRRWLIFTAGALAAAAGGGWSWWRTQAAAKAGAEAAEAAEFWTQRFPKPEGGELVMVEQRGRVLVLNFWATWCPPCVKEMPELDRFARAYAARGVRVIGVAIDNPAPVREFLRRTPVSYSIGLAGFEGTELSRKLGNERGGLPFTAFFDRRGVLTERQLGETSFAELARWAKSA